MAFVENLRDYYAARLPVLDVPNWFTHTSPVNRPQAPVYPAGLTAPEKAQVDAWLPSATGRDDSTLTLPNALTMANKFKAYWIAIDAWRTSDNLARIAQYRLALADAHIGSYDTVPASLSTTATPVSAPATTTIRAQTTPAGFPVAPGFSDVFDSGSGNEIIPTNATSVTISIWGPGGGGGGSGGSPYGGASGGYSTKTIAIAAGDWGTAIPYVVGNRGTGNTSSGTAGTTTSVGSVAIVAGTINMSANSGGGGTGAGGGTGGTASGGSTNTSGSSGTTAKGANAPGNGGIGGDYATQGANPGAGGGPGSSAQADKGGNGAWGRVQFVWT